MLRKEGDAAHACWTRCCQALVMLERRPPGRRRIILMIAEKRDRASAAKLPEVMERVNRLNAAVYWLTYSPFLQPFTVKPKTAEDLKPEAERIKLRQCDVCPAPDDTPVPPDLGPGGLIYGIGELIGLQRAGSFDALHEDHRRTKPGFPEEECIGANDSTGERRGASPVHSQLRAEGRRAGIISCHPGDGEEPAGTASKDARGILGALNRGQPFLPVTGSRRRTRSVGCGSSALVC